jgi:CheY-like chemotaxis protein
MQMPEMDGVQVGKLIKEKNPELPVILLSSIGDEMQRKHSHLFGSVLTKPVKQQQLLRAIQLELKTQPREEEVKAADKPVSLLSEEFGKLYPLNLLMAEDNLINQKLLLKVLSKLGYQCKVANNGQEAVAFIDKENFDVVLMDVQMPVMDGLEATKKIRAELKNQPYIIALTANAMIEDREICLGAGMDNYVSKPIKIEELIGVLKLVFENKLSDERLEV